MIFTFIRHLPTDWNQVGYLQGNQDIPISSPTDEIIKQIQTNKDKLKEYIEPTIILCSTLQRTYQTAKLYGYEPVFDVLLNEWNFGRYEGRPKSELSKEFGLVWQESPLQLHLGESGNDLQNRIITFLNKYDRHDHVLVFGHGSWIRACLSFINNGNINNMNQLTLQNNQCITINYTRRTDDGSKHHI